MHTRITVNELAAPMLAKFAMKAGAKAAPYVAGAVKKAAIGAAGAAAPYAAGAAAAYGAKKYIQHKMRKKREQGIADKAANQAVAKYKAQNEGMGAAYMPDAEMKKTPEREITSKAVLKQLNRNRNRGAMKGKVRTPNVRYVHDRLRDTDLTATHRGKTVINPEGKKKGNLGIKKKGDKTAGKKAKSPQSRKRKARKKD